MTRGPSRGQTILEFLLLVGLITAMAVPALNGLYPGVQLALRAVVECMVNDQCD